jgi:hypothetical protein
MKTAEAAGASASSKDNANTKNKKEKLLGAESAGNNKHLDGDDDDTDAVWFEKYTDRVNNVKEDDALDKKIQDAEMLRDLYIREEIIWEMDAEGF